MMVVIVTRHKALLEYILEQIGSLAGHEDTWVQTHVSDPQEIRGKIVIGVLPLHLAAEAAEVWEYPMDIPKELRGQELTLEQVRQYARPLRKYKVTVL